MVMQAEHIPVHLGAMPAAVQAVADAREDGDERPWIVNDPYAGGTHLPDITVVTPRAATSASPPAARTTPTSAARRPARCRPTAPRSPTRASSSPRARSTDDAIDELVAQMRNPDQRRADLRAQLAANRAGAARLKELAEKVGADELRAATDEVQDYAERRMRACIGALDDAVHEAEDVLEANDEDIRLCLKATVDEDELTLDFTGSADQHRGQPQLPARGDRVGVPVRGARPHRPGHPRQRRRRPAARP